MDVRVNGEFIPRNKDYSKYYTPLLRVKLTAEQMTFNGFRGMFILRVFRMTTDQLKYKDLFCYFGMKSNATQTPKITMFDLNPDVNLVTVIAKVKDDGYCYIYAKGGNSSDIVSCQVLYAPYKSFIEILDDENVSISNVTDFVSPTYLKNNLTFNTGWSATSSKQRENYTQYGEATLDYFITTTTDSCIATDYVIGTVALKPKYNKSFYCMYMSTDGSLNGICELYLDRATSQIKCKTNVPKNAFIHLNITYKLDAS